MREDATRPGPATAARTGRRAVILSAFGLAAAACTPVVIPAGPPRGEPALAADALVMADGVRLPLHAWLPEGPPRAVIVALHGFNEYSRSFVADAAPGFAAGGVALYAYDQRGFGRAPNRGIWPGSATLAADAAAAARLIAARHPGAPVFLMGESMGGAVLMVAETGADPPPAQGLILLAPAVLGRAHIPAIGRVLLDVAVRTVPVVAVSSSAPPGMTPTNNMAAWQRWSRDPLVIGPTRFDTASGLFDLMDEAIAATPRFGLPRGGRALPVLVLYGGQDRFITPVATRAMLRRLPEAGRHRLAFYPQGRHMLLRDSVAPEARADILAWIAAPDAPLPSGADAAARRWLGAP